MTRDGGRTWTYSLNRDGASGSMRRLAAANRGRTIVAFLETEAWESPDGGGSWRAIAPEDAERIIGQATDVTPSQPPGAGGALAPSVSHQPEVRSWSTLFGTFTTPVPPDPNVGRLYRNGELVPDQICEREGEEIRLVTGDPVDGDRIWVVCSTGITTQNRVIDHSVSDVGEERLVPQSGLWGGVPGHARSVTRRIREYVALNFNYGYLTAAEIAEQLHKDVFLAGLMLDHLAPGALPPEVADSLRTATVEALVELGWSGWDHTGRKVSVPRLEYFYSAIRRDPDGVRTRRRAAMAFRSGDRILETFEQWEALGRMGALNEIVEEGSICRWCASGGVSSLSLATWQVADEARDAGRLGDAEDFIRRGIAAGADPDYLEFIHALVQKELGRPVTDERLAQRARRYTRPSATIRANIQRQIEVTNKVLRGYGDFSLSYDADGQVLTVRNGSWIQKAVLPELEAPASYEPGTEKGFLYLRCSEAAGDCVFSNDLPGDDINVYQGGPQGGRVVADYVTRLGEVARGVASPSPEPEETDASNPRPAAPPPRPVSILERIEQAARGVRDVMVQEEARQSQETERLMADAARQLREAEIARRESPENLVGSWASGTNSEGEHGEFHVRGGNGSYSAVFAGRISLGDRPLTTFRSTVRNLRLTRQGSWHTYEGEANCSEWYRSIGVDYRGEEWSWYRVTLFHNARSDPPQPMRITANWGCHFATDPPAMTKR